MHEMLRLLYQVSGVANVQSPWIATLLVFSFFAVYVLALAGIFGPRLWQAEPPATVEGWVLSLAWTFGYGLGAVVAVGIEANIRSASGLADDDWFSGYWLVLLVLAHSPLLLLRWRQRNKSRVPSNFKLVRTG